MDEGRDFGRIAEEDVDGKTSSIGRISVDSYGLERMSLIEGGAKGVCVQEVRDTIRARTRIRSESHGTDTYLKWRVAPRMRLHPPTQLNLK